MEFSKTRSGIVLAMLLTSVCYYFGNGLNGNFWFLVWIAPIPVLCLAFANPGRLTFFAAFIAYLIGRMSLLSYLVTVATIPPAVIYTIAPALIFGSIVLVTRAAAQRRNARVAVFAFPVLFTAFEYLLFRFSPDGTALSIAYSQMNFLPLIQIASVTGILGICFIITLIPSSIAFCFRKYSAGFSFLIIPGLLIGAVFLLGGFRLGHAIRITSRGWAG